MVNQQTIQGTTIWEKRFCIAPACPADTLYVQRRNPQHEVWRVKDQPEQSGWLVAAIEPICPYCGGHLLTQANLDDGI